MDVLGSSKITSKTLTLEETLKLIKCNAYLEYFLKHLAFVLLLNDGSNSNFIVHTVCCLCSRHWFESKQSASALKEKRENRRGRSRKCTLKIIPDKRRERKGLQPVNKPRRNPLEHAHKDLKL